MQRWPFPVREECHGQEIARLLPALESGSIDMIVSNMTMIPGPQEKWFAQPTWLPQMK